MDLPSIAGDAYRELEARHDEVLDRLEALNRQIESLLAEHQDFLRASPRPGVAAPAARG